MHFKYVGGRGEKETEIEKNLIFRSGFLWVLNTYLTAGYSI